MVGEPISFIAALIAEKRTAYDWVQYGNLEPLFVTTWEKGVHNFVDNYIRQNGKMPTRTLLLKKFDDPFKCDVASAYAHDQMRKRFLEHVIRSNVADISSLLEDDDKYDPDIALSKLGSALMAAKMAVNPTMLLDSIKAIPDIWKQYMTKLELSPSEKGLMLGWPTVDDGTGGIEGGDVISLVGRPATGKTWFLLWIASKGWEQNRRCAFITLEMPAKQIIERQIGIVTETDYGPIKSKIPMVPEKHDQVEKWIAGLEDEVVPFYTIDSRMAATVPDIEMYCQAIDANVIYIDGAYLLRHANASLNRYQRVAENMDMLKDMAMRLNVPVICSWQFNRDAAKKFKKKAEASPDLEDIGYSDAIAQHSSIVLGLLQDEHLGTINQRQVHILKGRGGEQGTFHVAWDFVHSNFGELSSVIEKDAIYLD